MKKRDNSTAGVNQGFSQQDQNYLRKYDNAEAGPKWQLLTEEDLEEEDPEQRHYFCAICKSKLDFLTDTETMWRCNNCMQYYDTSIQDAPIKDLNESKVKTFPELSHYPTYDESDMYIPFVQSINPDADEETVPSNIEVISDDGRHKHIRVKGLPTEALCIMNDWMKEHDR